MSAGLFSLALGGYGLFGVITEVTLKVSDNVPLVMDSLQLSLATSSKSKPNSVTHGANVLGVPNAKPEDKG